MAHNDKGFAIYTMDNIKIEDLLQDVKSIKDETQYWLVRTMGGDYYTHYVEENFIAVGYNEITVDDLTHLPQKEKHARKMLQEMIVGRIGDIKKKGYIASQMIRFTRDMKIGDIVIVPAYSSYKVTFGIVRSEIYEETKNLHIEGRCPFAKRRTVEWIKTSLRYSLVPELQLMFNSRHIISEVNGYAPFIDNFLNDFYTKGDYTYLVLRVKQEEILSADDFTLINDLMELFNEYSKEYELGITSKDIGMKMCVQSPGDILAFAQSMGGIAAIGLIIMFIKGGTFKINCNQFHLETKVPTIGESFSQIVSSLNTFLNDRRRRSTIEKLERKLDNMEIETPSAIIELMKELGKENESENRDQ